MEPRRDDPQMVDDDDGDPEIFGKMLQQAYIGFETAGRSAYADNWKIVANLFFLSLRRDCQGAAAMGQGLDYPFVGRDWQTGKTISSPISSCPVDRRCTPATHLSDMESAIDGRVGNYLF